MSGRRVGIAAWVLFLAALWRWGGGDAAAGVSVVLGVALGTYLYVAGYCIVGIVRDVRDDPCLRRRDDVYLVVLGTFIALTWPIGVPLAMLRGERGA